jgi:diguanylate cyclase (GGDEF)-like protein/PAS domain S-box-containing protein
VTTKADALARMAEAEDTLRAIGAGEVDAFVVSDGTHGGRVFTLATADRPYRMFVENMRDGAATLSPTGLILYANRRLAELLGCPRETIVGSPLTRFLARPDDGLEQIRGPGGLGTTIEIELRGAAGTRVPVQVGSSPLMVDGAQLLCLTFTDLSAHKAKDREIARLGRAQDERMTELQAAQAALTTQATHDALTGLPNRALLVDRIDQAIAGCKRSGRYMAVLFVDLDRFKQVNDTHGHAAGDVALRNVAEKLGAALRPSDTVSRIGGDEFVVLAPEIDSRLDAVDIGMRLLSELGRRRPGRADEDRVAASIGISVSAAGRGTAETLLKEADTAMYEAKSLGGRRIAVFDAALGRQVRQRSVARGILQSALNDDRIVAHYQPIVDLASGSLAGFEALARIAGADGSVTPPSAFIPAAEESGLVVPLGTQVLKIALEQASGWPVTTGRLNIAVNLSSRQFEAGDLPTLIADELARTGLAADCLHLELTETAVMDLDVDLLDQLNRIATLGVQVGLDDFGTGYASLTHLRRLPLAFVKIDRSFVQGVGVDHEDDRIIAAMVDLAANLGLRSIAEGVETTAQLRRLRDLGCDEGQGYLFAYPLAPADVPAAIGRLTAPPEARGAPRARRPARRPAAAAPAAPRGR